MQNFEKARENMIDCQVRTADVTSHSLLTALLQVPRESFVPDNKQELAYIDEDLPVADDRFLMEPAPFAKLVQALSIQPGEVVLDVGCCTGYSSAVLSRMATTVIALEENDALAAEATEILDELDYDNVAVVVGKLTDGLPGEGPYDAIFIGGAVDEVPQKLLDQLRDGGRLIAVVGRGNSAVARLFVRSGDDVSGRILFNCAVMPLPGFAKQPVFEF
jgi:protein-L-isoaspartate(D-aspartate) O-methyltransferase